MNRMSLKNRVVSAVSIAVAAGLVALGFLVLGGGRGGHTVVARFADAGFLQPGNTVRIGGVTAGSIEKLTVSNNVASVYLHLNPGFWPLHRNASAQVRPISLLGEEYVQVNPGSPSQPLMASGAVIPESRTSTSVNLQSILDSLNSPTSSSLALLVSALGQGMAGQGTNVAAAIRALQPALTNTNSLLKLLDQQNQLLSGMIANVKPVVAALDTHNGTDLSNLVSNTSSLLGATAAQDQALGRDVANLPPTLAAATSAFNQLGSLSGQATPAFQSITPLTSKLPAISTELSSFSRAADQAVTVLPSVLTQARSLIDNAAPVVQTLQTQAATGLSDVNSSIPIVQKNVADLNNLFGFIKNWALATQDYDNVSHYFRFFANVSSYSEVGQLPVPVKLLEPGGTPARKAASPAVKLPTLPLLGTGSNPIATVLGGLLGGGQATSGSKPGPTPASSSKSLSATGLSSGQEQNLLGYLLGGI